MYFFPWMEFKKLIFYFKETFNFMDGCTERGSLSKFSYLHVTF